jgi:hypothetical protein
MAEAKGREGRYSIAAANETTLIKILIVLYKYTANIMRPP